MGAVSRLTQKQKGISIITCTNRQDYIVNVFNNYRRQRYPKKELIIIINNDKIKLNLYKEMAKKYKHVQIYHLPEQLPLGACLNYAVKKTKHSYIAKFDDDDYYAPNYLTDTLRAFRRTNADIVGKRAHFMYLRGSKMLILRFHKDENRYVSILPGATLVIKREVFRNVQFPNQSIGEDDKFCLDSEAKGYKIYSAGKYNFVAIRRKNSKNHTWIISDKKLLAINIKFPHVQDFKKFVRKTPSGPIMNKPSSSKHIMNAGSIITFTKRPGDTYSLFSNYSR